MKTSKKTILVGIDYTKSSQNAIEYAAKLAEKGHASLLLFHIYETPVIHTNSGLYFISYESVGKSNKEKLEKYTKYVRAMHPKVEVKSFVTSNSFQLEIEELIRRKTVQYVVLGMETKSRISKFIYGSHSTAIAGKVNCPVIIVPEKYKTKSFSKAVFAVDNDKAIGAKTEHKVEAFTEAFGFKLTKVHVRTEDEVGLEPMQLKKNKIDIVEAKNFPDGMRKYSRTKPVDLVIILSHAHSSLYKLFNETNTKKIAFQSKVPVMAIHE